jgi:hypothetical protein
VLDVFPHARVRQDAETEAALNSVEEAVEDFFGLVLNELKELEDGNGLQE